MKTIRILPILLLFPLSGTAQIQRDPGVPLLTAEERAVIDEQSAGFNRAIEPVIATAAESTVRVWSGTRRLAYGTVVDDGSIILTKWSELLRARGDLRVEADGDELRAVSLAGVYPGHDLALLEIHGDPLPAVAFDTTALPDLGSFLATPQPDGRLAAFGVVAVPARNLRQTDQAFLGVQGDPRYEDRGVRIADVVEDSAAANAGIRNGDVILSVDDREVNGLYELRNSLNGVPPGASLPLTLERDGRRITRDVIMGSRPEFPRFPGARLQRMERLGGPISRVRDEFPSAIETDMRPLPNQIGGPVVDLGGRVVGITLARAGRTRSYVMPAANILEMLASDPEDPAVVGERVAAARENNHHQGIHAPRQAPAEPGRGSAPSPERMDRHLSDMQRLLDLMLGEMDKLER